LINITKNLTNIDKNVTISKTIHMEIADRGTAKQPHMEIADLGAAKPTLHVEIDVCGAATNINFHI
jgi:hypothetical protein